MPGRIETIERRFVPAGQTAEMRVAVRADGGPMLVGYAAVFYDPADAGTEYRLWGDVYERILPGAFDRAVKEDDVRALFNHEASIILGRNKAGTLRLFVDAKGLRYEADPPDTEQARAVIEAIRRGDVSGSSFGFLPDKTRFLEEQRDGKMVTVVEREAVELFDVSPVTFPAYASASSGLRSAGDCPTTRADVDRWLSKRWGVPRDVVMARARCVEIAR